jgi:hypothetical protein
VLVDNTLPAINVTSPGNGAVLAGTVGFDATVADGGSGIVSITMLAAGGAPNVVDGSTTPKRFRRMVWPGMAHATPGNLPFG